MWVARYALCQLTVALGVCLATLNARAAFDYGNEDWQGSSEFLSIARERLGADRVQIAAVLDYEQLSPRDAVLALHPTVRLDYDEISAFLRDGGRFALIDDHGRGDELLQHFQIQRVQAPLRPQRMLRNNSSIAIATPAVHELSGEAPGRHPIVAGVEHVVTNHPTVLEHPNLTPVLTIAAADGSESTLALTGIIVNRGRLFAMGDPSAFINLMLRYPGNRELAGGLIEYLVEDDSWGPRQGKLVLVANNIEQIGHYGGEASLATELADHVEGALDAVHQMHQEGMPELLAQALAALLAIAIAIWIFLVAAKPYRRLTPRYAAGQPIVTQPGLAGRAAVLAAPTTQKALVVLELKTALEEALRLELGLPPNANRDAILTEINRQNRLSRPSLAKLEHVLSQLSRIEESIASARPTKVRAAQVADLNLHVERILSEVQGRT